MWLETAAALDGMFHKIITRASGSNPLFEVSDMLTRRNMRRCLVKSVFALETVLEALEGHPHIRDCIRRGAEHGLGRAIRERLVDAKSSIKQMALTEQKTGSPGICTQFIR